MNSHRVLTKSDFQDFLNCPECFWLRRHRPHVLTKGELSPSDLTRLRDGQAVERHSAAFLGALYGGQLTAQFEFRSDALLARADFILADHSGSVEIFEVKASTAIKEKGARSHLVDVAFQAIAAERAGFTVKASKLVHLNGTYQRQGELDVSRLFAISDVSERVQAIKCELERDIQHALALWEDNDRDLSGCKCAFKSKKDRCAAFGYLNPQIGEDSAHCIPRISPSRLRTLAPSFDIRALTTEDLTPAQALVLKAFQRGRPVVDRPALVEFFRTFEYPIHFYDYETTAPAVPPMDGYRPYAALPVQFSVHRLEVDGSLTHREFLADRHGEQPLLVEALRAAIGDGGSAVAWHKQFEVGCNARLAELSPQNASFLADLSERTVDLETPFKRAYIDWAFRGSTSIKKVLPVLVPDLNYDDSKVHDGTGAVEAWSRMIEEPEGAERARLRVELLDYCRLDTLAMVRVFEALRAVTNC